MSNPTITLNPVRVTFSRTYPDPQAAYSALSSLGHANEHDDDSIKLLRAFCCTDSPYGFMSDYYERLECYPEDAPLVSASITPTTFEDKHIIAFSYREGGLTLELHDTTLTASLDRSRARRGNKLYEYLTEVFTRDEEGDSCWPRGTGLVTPEWVAPDLGAVLRFLTRAYGYQWREVEDSPWFLLWHPTHPLYYYDPTDGQLNYLRKWGQFTFAEVCRSLTEGQR